MKGNIFVGGYYDSTTTVGGNNEQSAGGRDGFVARLMFNGDVDWIRSCGGPYDDEIRGVVVDPKNIPYVCGVFDTYADFEDQRIQGDRFTDVFVAALDCGPSTTLKPRVKQLDICEGQDSLIQSRFGYPAYQWFVNGTLDPTFTNYTFRTGLLLLSAKDYPCQPLPALAMNCAAMLMEGNISGTEKTLQSAVQLDKHGLSQEMETIVCASWTPQVVIDGLIIFS